MKIVFVFFNLYISGADPGFQVRWGGGGGGGALKNCTERREMCLGISCEKSRFYDKKIIFFPILGGGGGAPGAPPPGSAPAYSKF